jgi:hypothetical protein
MEKLEKYGVQEMDAVEMKEVDGGFFPLLIVGACLLLSSCVQTNQNNGSGTQTNTQSTHTKIDSSQVNLKVSPK